MTNQYYLRSILPSGEGECVVPEFKKPDKLDFEFISDYEYALSGWEDLISRLPISAIASKELSKLNGVGFIKDCVVKKQAQYILDEWVFVTDETFNYYDEKFRRILLDVPDEVTNVPEKKGHPLGKLISGRMMANMVSQLPDIPVNIVEQIKTDCYYPNSIPVYTLRNVCRLLAININEAEESIWLTFEELKKKHGQLKHEQGSELWENKTSIEKYIAILKEIWLEGVPDPTEKERGIVIAPSTEAGEETITLTRKQVEDIWDASYRFTESVYGANLYDDLLTEPPNKENYINSLFNKQP